MGIKELPRVARFIPKIMLAITVTACDEVYRKIACWLNDMGESEDICMSCSLYSLTQCSCHLNVYLCAKLLNSLFKLFINTVFNQSKFY